MTTSNWTGNTDAGYNERKTTDSFASDLLIMGAIIICMLGSSVHRTRDATRDMKLQVDSLNMRLTQLRAFDPNAVSARSKQEALRLHNSIKR